MHNLFLKIWIYSPVVITMSIDAILSPIFLSLRVAACATILVTILGTIVGRALARSSWRYKVLLETIFLLPMVLPPTVIGFFLIIIFGNNSPIGKWVESLFQQSIMFTSTAAIIASTVVAFPLMYQSAKTDFLSQMYKLKKVLVTLAQVNIKFFCTLHFRSHFLPY